MSGISYTLPNLVEINLLILILIVCLFHAVLILPVMMIILTFNTVIAVMTHTINLTSSLTHFPQPPNTPQCYQNSPRHF